MMLTNAEYKILTEIYIQKKCNPTQIYKTGKLSPATTYMNIKPLITKGYITKTDIQKSTYNLTLTRKGTKLMEALKE